MAAMELRFNQQDSAKIYSSVFGMEQPVVNDDGETHDEEYQNTISIRGNKLILSHGSRGLERQHVICRDDFFL